MNELPRVRLNSGPTPVHELKRLADRLDGPRLWVKRDDLTSLALGGNKTRKLEFLIAEALRQGADTVITAGGVQSNHCRLTAAAATLHGLRCELVLGGDPPDRPATGNLLLDGLFGARVHWSDPTAREATMASRAKELRGQGRVPYVIPVGGSNGLGGVGYVAAMAELCAQLRDRGQAVDHIIVASSSGGTQAGLVVGARLSGFRGRVLGISIDQPKAGGLYPQRLSAIANDTASILGVREVFEPADFDLDYDYLGAGYGVIGALERDAIAQAALCEALLVGPVYTARALGAMLEMIRRGEFASNETVLFWHTGDTPTLFAYGEQLTTLPP